MHLHLIGYRGCGKTTVARVLAQRLGLSTVDADEHLEQAAGQTIKEIFAAEGESGFRDRESSVANELTRQAPRVISWGGGVILREANRVALKSTGRIIWLRARPETLLQRIEQDPTTGARRPNLTVAGGLAEIKQLLAAREPIYQTVSDWQIDVDDLGPDQIVERILGWLKQQGTIASAKGEPG